MLKYVDTRVCFQEVPDEISLCINLSGCPHKCEGCHSPYLQEDVGEELTKKKLTELIEANDGITCVCFMGGDNNILQLHSFAWFVRHTFKLHTAWYSGLSFIPKHKGDRKITEVFDYIKTGPYIEICGPLTSKTTNQRMYARGSVLHKMDANPHVFYDITDKFWKDDTNS